MGVGHPVHRLDAEGSESVETTDRSPMTWTRRQRASVRGYPPRALRARGSSAGVDNTALSLPSANRASLAQSGLLAWNDDTPYDDLSVGYASLKIEFLER